MKRLSALLLLVAPVAIAATPRPFHGLKLDHAGKALKHSKLWTLSDDQDGPDWATGSLPGTNTEKAYSELKLKTPKKPILVAVIDSGFDMQHEDLAGQWAINEKELNGLPGVDDDGNGYVDDVSGWNFLGTTVTDSMEILREHLRLKNLGRALTAEESAYLAEIEEALPFYHANYGENPENPSAPHCMMESEAVPDEMIVGNAQSHMPEEGNHGTHVAGSIAALRGNDKGMDGQASPYVKILPLRAVSNCDERDINVAKAIRYAVDNGARIINMSFGKGFQSPRYALVREAIRHAEEKGVLLVHAAGNGSQNNDTSANFPTSVMSALTMRGHLAGGSIERATNWLEIGASSEQLNERLNAAFTNFGKLLVDVFAPGVRIRSTVPGNQYAAYSGTSMAAPNAAGVAALVLSQKPSMTAQELRKVLLETANRSVADQVVKQPDTGERIRFAELSVTGAILDAYAALRKIGVELK